MGVKNDCERFLVEFFLETGVGGGGAEVIIITFG